MGDNQVSRDSGSRCLFRRQRHRRGLFKLDPGAVVPLHEHTALEQTYVLEGTIEDHEGVCGPGQFCWRPGGNQHEAVIGRTAQ